MTTTPEGKVKSLVKDLLAEYGSSVYYLMPVPNGYGKSTLDFIGAFYGRAFAVETKKPGEFPNERQLGIIEDITNSRTPVFVIDGPATLECLRRWLKYVELTHGVSAGGGAAAPHEPVGGEGAGVRRSAASVLRPDAPSGCQVSWSIPT
jgi:hypothetical protein